jgi:hypothetical protein
MGVFDIVMEKPAEISRRGVFDIVMEKPAEVSRSGECV